MSGGTILQYGKMDFLIQLENLDEDLVGFEFKGWREASRSDRLRWDT